MWPGDMLSGAVSRDCGVDVSFSGVAKGGIVSTDSMESERVGREKVAVGRGEGVLGWVVGCG